MTERMNSSDMDDENFDIPDDIAELVADIHDRAEQRRRAVEILITRAKQSDSLAEQQYLLATARRFAEVYREFRHLYPEVLSNDQSDDK